MTKHHELPLGHCLGCLPVRFGVLAFSSFILVLSLCAVAGLVSEDTRLLVGGYTYWSRVAVDLLGVSGVVLSSMAIIGLQDNHARWVKLFVYFSTIRVIARVFILWADARELRKCEHLGLTSITDHYNPAMEAVKLSRTCNITTAWYWVISVFDILISLYGTYNAYCWCFYVENSPMYHIHIDDTKPLRIYTGYSTVGHPEAPPTVKVPNNAGHPQSHPHWSYNHPSMVNSSIHMHPHPAGSAPMHPHPSGFMPPPSSYPPPPTLPPGSRATMPM